MALILRHPSSVLLSFFTFLPGHGAIINLLPMKPIRVFIVEDETLNIDIITAHLENLGYQVAGKARSGEEALASIEQHDPDLVLLDINLEHGRGQMDGVELGTRLRQQYRFPLIFITSYQDRKTQQRTDRIRPDGYLTKPISEAGLAFAIESALEKASETFIRPEPLPEPDLTHADAEGTSYLLEDFLFVKEQAAYRKVPVSDIWFIQSEANYLTIHRSEGPLLVSTNLSNFARQFEHPSLLRVSRSHIINVHYIEGFEDQHTVIVAGQAIPIGKTYRQAVQQRFRFLKTSR